MRLYVASKATGLKTADHFPAFCSESGTQRSSAAIMGCSMLCCMRRLLHSVKHCCAVCRFQSKLFASRRGELIRRKNSRAPTLMCVAVTAFLCLPHTAMAESGKLSAAEQLSAETAEAAAEQSTARAWPSTTCPSRDTSIRWMGSGRFMSWIAGSRSPGEQRLRAGGLHVK